MAKYRLLNEGKKLKKYDEYYDFDNDQWRKVTLYRNQENVVKDTDIVRRKMKKGKWRLLEPGEIIKKKDQFKRYGEWHRVYQYGVYVTGQLPYRRRRKK